MIATRFFCGGGDVVAFAGVSSLLEKEESGSVLPEVETQPQNAKRQARRQTASLKRGRLSLVFFVDTCNKGKASDRSLRVEYVYLHYILFVIFCQAKKHAGGSFLQKDPLGIPVTGQAAPRGFCHISGAKTRQMLWKNLTKILRLYLKSKKINVFLDFSA